METTAYFEIVKKRWRLVAIGMVATVAFTALFVSFQPSVFESSGTYVVRPRSGNVDDAARAIETLVRGVEINSTFANIAGSDLIKSRARELVDASISTSGLKTAGRVIAGTNILEFSVTGEDPNAVYALAAALGDVTADYVQNLDEVFELTLLDPPRVPKVPVGPNRVLTMMLSVVLGALLGAALAVGAEALSPDRGSDVESDSGSSPDPSPGADLELLDENQLGQLFGEQLARADAGQTSFTLGMLTVDSGHSSAQNTKGDPTSAELDRLARLNMPSYSHHWRVVSLGDGSFAVMASDLPADGAEELVAAWLKVWKAAIGGTGYPGVDLNGSVPHISIGVSSFGGADGLEPPSLAAEGSIV
jgi:capsular polysaccharide biosynthesis protein